MNNIASHLPNMGFSSRQNSQPDLQTAAYVKEQSLKTRQNLDTGLVIQTKEGDLVTLTANSYSHLDSYMYDARGVVQTDNAIAAYSHSQRELTLASGQSFSFTVEGSLSEAELADIEAMLKDLDGVIEEVKQGNVAEAMDEAMEMGGYDSVATYSADIRYQSSYEMSSYTSAAVSQTTGSKQAPGAEPVEASEQPGSSTPITPGKKLGHLLNVDNFIDKLFKKMEQLEQKTVAAAKEPAASLLQHHLDNLGSENDDNSVASMLERTIEKIDTIFDRLLGQETEVNDEPERKESEEDD